MDNNEETFQRAAIASQVSDSDAKSQQANAARVYMQEQEKNLAETQLEVDEILREVYHMLRQDVLRKQDDGSLDWEHITDKKQRVLTDYAVDRLMQVMKTYINKNTLLSNFSEEQIKRRMLNFGLSLNANIFMKYELYFREPTIEECEEILEERIENSKKKKRIAMQLSGIESDEEKLKSETYKEIEGRIEKELHQIKLQKRRQNLREYELLFRQLEAMVEATHNRAYRGEERGSLRRHMNVSEVLSGTGNNQRSSQDSGRFGWIRG